MNATACESCGMPMTSDESHALGDPASSYCQFCTTDTGELEPFEDRFGKMTAWTMRKDSVDVRVAEDKTRDYMRGMPAWKDHPSLRA